ncbi:MAG: MraY family glycosyltransferase [Thermoguttaceae bacterium]
MGLVDVVGPFGLAAGALWLVGIRDDIRPLSARCKLLCQTGVALLIVWSGFCPENVALLGHHVHLGWFGAVCMMGWLVLGINALNLIDGMDGLASVTGIVISTAIAITAGIQGNLPTLVLAMALAGGLAGFLVHNLPPATIFLGDSGSTFIGLVLSFLAFQFATDASATVHVTALVLLLFVPLLDTQLAIARRLLMGRSIFRGDRSHLHHQLLGRGFGIWKTLGLLGILSAVSVAAACLAAITGRELAAWATVLGSTGLLVAGRYIGGQELTLLRQALGGAAQEQSDLGLPSDPLSHLPEIIPLDWRLARKPTLARSANADYESEEPSEQRRAA